MEYAMSLIFASFRLYKSHFNLLEDSNDTGTEKYCEVFWRKKGPC